eukprot:4614677-Alexandrium_andersonii.AAC.1
MCIRDRSLGAQACANAWAEHVKLAARSEQIKPAFVDACMTVWNRALAHDDLRLLVVKADEELELFDSVYKLEAVIKKAGSYNQIRWCICAIIDAVRHLGVTAPEIALRQLTGRGLAGGKGLLDTYWPSSRWAWP